MKLEIGIFIMVTTKQKKIQTTKKSIKLKFEKKNHYTYSSL